MPADNSIGAFVKFSWCVSARSRETDAASRTEGKEGVKPAEIKVYSVLACLSYPIVHLCPGSSQPQ